MPWFITVQVHKRIVRTKKRRYKHLPVPYTSLHHHQYRWGKQRSGMEDREGKPGFACQSTAGNSPLSQLIIRNGSLHNDWQRRHVKEKRSFQSDVKMNSQVSRVRHGFLSLKGFWVQRILEPVRFHGCPGLTLHGQYQESCTVMVDRHGRPPEFASQSDLPEGGVWEVPFVLTVLTWRASPLPFSDVGIPWTQKPENIKMQIDFFPLFPAFPLFRKCIVTYSGYKMEQGRPHLDLFFLLLLLKQIK